jgi:hypothetical protein
MRKSTRSLCFQTLSVYVPPLISETKFLTNTKLRPKIIILCILSVQLKPRKLFFHPRSPLSLGLPTLIFLQSPRIFLAALVWSSLLACPIHSNLHLPASAVGSVLCVLPTVLSWFYKPLAQKLLRACLKIVPPTYLIKLYPLESWTLFQNHIPAGFNSVLCLFLLDWFSRYSE